MSHDPHNPDVDLIVIWEDTGLVIMSRILGRDAEPITISTITSIRCEVMDALTEEQVAVISVDPDDVLFDTLQTDDRWSADSVGYNFAHEVPYTAFPEAGQTYRLSYLFTPLIGNPLPLSRTVQTKKLFA